MDNNYEREEKKEQLGTRVYASTLKNIRLLSKHLDRSDASIAQGVLNRAFLEDIPVEEAYEEIRKFRELIKQLKNNKK